MPKSVPPMTQIFRSLRQAEPGCAPSRRVAARARPWHSAAMAGTSTTFPSARATAGHPTRESLLAATRRSPGNRRACAVTGRDRPPPWYSRTALRHPSCRSLFFVFIVHRRTTPSLHALRLTASTSSATGDPAFSHRTAPPRHRGDPVSDVDGVSLGRTAGAVREVDYGLPAPLGDGRRLREDL